MTSKSETVKSLELDFFSKEITREVRRRLKALHEISNQIEVNVPKISVSFQDITGHTLTRRILGPNFSLHRNRRNQVLLRNRWYSLARNNNSGWYELRMWMCRITKDRKVKNYFDFIGTFPDKQSAVKVAQRRLDNLRNFKSCGKDYKALFLSGITVDASFFVDQAPPRSVLKIRVAYSGNLNQVVNKKVIMICIIDAMLESKQIDGRYYDKRSNWSMVRLRNFSFIGRNVLGMKILKHLPFEIVFCFTYEKQKYVSKPRRKIAKKSHKAQIKLKSSEGIVSSNVALKMCGHGCAIVVSNEAAEKFRVANTISEKIVTRKLKSENLYEIPMKHLFSYKTISMEKLLSQDDEMNVSDIDYSDHADVLNFAATTIQNLYRFKVSAWMIRRYYMILLAKLRISRFLKGNLVRKWFKGYRIVLLRAADWIKCLFWMRKLKKFTQVRFDAVLFLNKTVRIFLLKLRLRFIFNYNHHAKKIQYFYFCYLARERLRLLKEENYIHTVLYPAAIHLQDWWRRHEIIVKLNSFLNYYKRILTVYATKTASMICSRSVSNVTYSHCLVLIGTSNSLCEATYCGTFSYFVKLQSNFLYKRNYAVDCIGFCWRNYRWRRVMHLNACLNKGCRFMELIIMARVFQEFKAQFVFVPKIQRWMKWSCISWRIKRTAEYLKDSIALDKAKLIQRSYIRHRYRLKRNSIEEGRMLKELSASKVICRFYYQVVRNNRYFAITEMLSRLEKIKKNLSELIIDQKLNERAYAKNQEKILRRKKLYQTVGKTISRYLKHIKVISSDEKENVISNTSDISNASTAISLRYAIKLGTEEMQSIRCEQSYSEVSGVLLLLEIEASQIERYTLKAKTVRLKEIVSFLIRSIRRRLEHLSKKREYHAQRVKWKVSRV